MTVPFTDPQRPSSRLCPGPTVSPSISALVQCAAVLQTPTTPDLAGSVEVPAKTKSPILQWPRIVTRRRANSASPGKLKKDRSLPSSPAEMHRPLSSQSRQSHTRTRSDQTDIRPNRAHHSSETDRQSYAICFQTEADYLSEQLDDLARTNSLLHTKLQEARTFACELLSERNDIIASLTELNQLRERNEMLENILARMEREMEYLRSTAREEITVWSVSAREDEQERIERMRVSIKNLRRV